MKNLKSYKEKILEMHLDDVSPYARNMGNFQYFDTVDEYKSTIKGIIRNCDKDSLNDVCYYLWSHILNREVDFPRDNKKDFCINVIDQIDDLNLFSKIYDYMTHVGQNDDIHAY